MNISKATGDFVKTKFWRVRIERADKLPALEVPYAIHSSGCYDFPTRKSMREGKAILKRIYGNWYSVKTYQVNKSVLKSTGSCIFYEKVVY